MSKLLNQLRQDQIIQKFLERNNISSVPSQVLRRLTPPIQRPASQPRPKLIPISNTDLNR
jgi:hypothetical protein